MNKQLALLLASSLVALSAASAQVSLLLPTSTFGTGSFVDAPSGGYSETLTAPTITPNAGVWRTMDYPGFFSFSSVGPHVDSASLNMGITQTVAGSASMPFFSAAGSMTQLASSVGDVATLGFQFQSYFEGFMLGANPALALASLGINVSGTVGSVAGEYVSFNMQQDYFGPAYIGTLAWSYTNSTPGASFGLTVLPTWTFAGGSPTLTNNLISVQGFINVQADPSSISFAPVVAPEPGSLSLLLAAGIWMGSRRRRALTAV